MAKSNKDKPEEAVELQDLAIQEEDSESLQSDQQPQKSEDLGQNEASELGGTHKLMQQEKPIGKVKTQYSLQKSEENKSSWQECIEFVADEELKQKTDGDIMVQQKDETSFAEEQDSSQTNQSGADAIYKEFGVFSEHKLLESDVNATTQSTAKAPESILPNLDQETTRQDHVAYQDCDRSDKQKLEAHLTEQLRENTLEESSVASLDDPIRTAKQKTNDGLQQEYDRTSENDGHFQDRKSDQESEIDGQFQESESDQESKNSHHMCFLTQQLENEASPSLPRRICYHRTHTQRQRLPPVLAVPDEPLEPFEVEIPLSRNRRTLGARPPTVPTGFRNYLRRVSEHHIPPERRDRYEELQKRILKLFCGIVFGAFLYVVMVLLVNFLESKYSKHGDSNVTSPDDDFSDDLSTPVTDFKPDTSVICLEAGVTTPVLYSIDLGAGFDTEVTSVLNDMNGNDSNPVNDLE